MTALSPTDQRRLALESLIQTRATQRIRNAHASGDTDRLRASLSWQGQGRELRVEPLRDTAWPQVVACLNIWNDAPALAETIPSWAPHVDALVVADGPYAHCGTGPSTDSLTRVIGRFSLPTTYVPLPGEAWPNQREKRTALLQAAATKYPGALLLIVDADEAVSGADQLKAAPEGDVLWLDVSSPMYLRPYSQPRGIRAVPGLRYEGRHHWLYAGDRLLATHQYGGTGVEHRRLAGVGLRNHRGLGHTPERAALKRHITQFQWRGEAPATTGATQSDQAVGAREALRILQTTTYDAGMVGYRFHTALNVTTPHVSAFAAMGSRNAFGSPFQYDLNSPDDLLRCALLAAECDVLHCHLDYAPMRLLACVAPLVVIHHHGSLYRKNHALLNAVDADTAGLRLVSNLELTQYGDGLHFLPNPVPVARYRRLRTQATKPPGFRVAHSPSRRDYKGTDRFLAVCDRLASKGLNVVPVLIEGRTHAESLAIKATCDAAFDSFWLGLQCSGLEAAAMGLPVVAGDAFVAGKYREWLGAVPYTYAEDEAGLETALAQLVTDADFYATESARVAAYTVTHHDEAAVALTYLDLLDRAFQWRARLKVVA